MCMHIKGQPCVLSVFEILKQRPGSLYLEEIFKIIAVYSISGHTRSVPYLGR